MCHISKDSSDGVLWPRHHSDLIRNSREILRNKIYKGKSIRLYLERRLENVG
jgi:hypothetical protein